MKVQVALFTLLVKCADVDSANRGQETYGRGAASDPTYCVSSTIEIGNTEFCLPDARFRHAVIPHNRLYYCSMEKDSREGFRSPSHGIGPSRKRKGVSTPLYVSFFAANFVQKNRI